MLRLRLQTEAPLRARQVLFALPSFANEETKSFFGAFSKEKSTIDSWYVKDLAHTIWQHLNLQKEAPQGLLLKLEGYELLDDQPLSWLALKDHCLLK